MKEADPVMQPTRLGVLASGMGSRRWRRETGSGLSLSPW